MSRGFVRRAEPRDVGAICEIERECFAEPWSPDSVNDLISSDIAVCLCFEEDGKVLGYGSFYFAAYQAQINNVAVTKSARRRGIARMILSELIKISEKLGAESVTLEVRESNLPARALYESAGFEKDGIRKNYYHTPSSGTRENAILMSKRITDEK